MNNEFSMNKSTPLSGARIWLSGSVPEDSVSTPEQQQTIKDFVRLFARSVFERGGYIVHGSHPSLTDVLLEESKLHQENGGRKDSLVLAVSRLWSKDENTVPVNEWQETAIVYETPEVPGEFSRDESLKLLRQWMVARSDAIVVVGGKWWQSVSGKAGIPIELNLAVERGLPCFLLGGLGGAASDFVSNNPAILSMLKNGLDLEANRALSTKKDVASLAGEVCDHLERLPLVRGKESDGISFRILALDGGGIKGAYTAAVLAAWETHTNLRVSDHFDLIAGTSTGGILAIGLGLGLSAAEMLNFYRERGETIFPVTRLGGKIKHTMKHAVSPKYAQDILASELQKAFRPSDKTYIKESNCRLVIPAYHAIRGASHVFRTPHHPDLTADADTEAAYVALATAAAPTFFTAAKIKNMVAESSYFDGGVWANSPSMAAVVEAVCFLRIPIERIDVLSVGTTDTPFTVRKQLNSGGLGWIWKNKILDLLMNAQQESSLKLTKQLVDESRFLRINTTTQAGDYKLDSVDKIEELADLGQHEALQPDVLAKVKSRFLNGVNASPWQCFE